MAFTSTDLTTLETALTKLASGQRVVECTVDGDTVTYNRTNISDLLKLRDRIKGELAAADSTSNYGRARVAVTTKGY